MQRKLILDSDLLDLTINRLCHQILENHGDFRNTVLLGLQPRGIHLATLLHGKLTDLTGEEIPLGFLDVTFHRDDFRRRQEPALASETRIPFSIEEKEVVLVDDVLYTGRTVRSALDAMMSFGRPAKVELVVLVDRRYTRHLPIAPDYVGTTVNTLQSQQVKVELTSSGKKKNKIWLVNKD